jgi:hypothetical protein
VKKMSRNRYSGARNLISIIMGRALTDQRNLTADTDNTRCPNIDCKKELAQKQPERGAIDENNSQNKSGEEGRSVEARSTGMLPRDVIRI